MMVDVLMAVSRQPLVRNRRTIRCQSHLSTIHQLEANPARDHADEFAFMSVQQ